MRVLLLPVRQDAYAVPLDAVREVLEPGRLTPLPGERGALLGLINVRGEVVPVLDTAALLELPPLGAEGVVAVAVVRVDRGLAGLATSELPVADTLGDDLGPSSLGACTVRHRVLRGVATVVDLEAALAPERVAR